MTTFLFLRVTHGLLELRERNKTAVTRGEPRISSADQDPGAGSLPLPWVCPTAIPRPTRHPPPGDLRRFGESSVTIDVHGSLDRVKDVSSLVEALFRRLPRRVRALGARRRRSPPHSSRGHLLSPVRLPAWERAPCRRDGPAKTRVSPPAREG
jgi:hypothetical protein